MEINKKGNVLVVFGNNLPEKKEEWWKQFDTVIAPKKLEAKILQFGLSYVDLNSLVNSGNVQEASELVRTLSLLTVSDGRRISKLVNYQGYELWWIHYDDLMSKFCLPYTQYSRLLQYLKDFSRSYIYQPPFCDLFSCFLKSHKCKYVIDKEFKKKIPLGIFFQVILSIPFLLWTKIRRPKLMLWTSDLFDGSNDYDFRMKFIYEELWTKKINFIEFIRSMESTTTVVKHALKRRRPVIYSFAIRKFSHYLANLFSKKYELELEKLLLPVVDPMQRFQFEMAINYLRYSSGDIFAIQVLRLIIKFIGVKVLVIPVAVSRNFHEVLACKLNGVKSIGILHGFASKNYNVYDFMPDFDGDKILSVDKYGLWSEWWREYYIRNSKIYKPEQLYVSGPMRPLERKNISQSASNGLQKKDGPIKVLLVPGELSDPKETVSYLLSLMEAKNISVYLTFRPYRDAFENWLKANNPQIIEKIGKEKILLGNIHDAIAQCDVIVGSYSTGVLEALFDLKPIAVFSTKKWGDYFELKDYDKKYKFFAENPDELIYCIRKSREIPKDVLKKLQERFFGNPHMNGSKWVVEQAEDILKTFSR